MYEDHWFALAQETTSVQPQSHRPKPQSSYETDRCQIAVPLRANGLNHQKSIVSNGPPKADVLQRSHSIHDLRESTSANLINADRQVAIDRELMDERDVAIWYEELEDELQAANNDEFLNFQDVLKSHVYSCNRLLSESQQILTLLNGLSDGFEAVRDQTSSFQSACEDLLSEQTRLATIVDGLSTNLEPFSALESITRRLNTPGSDLVLKSDFKDMLLRLDDCLAYVALHPDFKDSEFYRSRYRQLLTRALALIKVYFTTQLREVTNDVTKRIAAKGVNDTTQQALLYAKFRAGAPQLRDLIYEIERRCDHEEYISLMIECYNAFSGARQRLLAPTIARTMAAMAANKDLISFAGASITYMRSICLDEYDLFYSYFSTGENQLYDFLEGLCDPLYDNLRPRIIHETELIKLCELCSLFQTRYMMDPDEDGDAFDRNQLDFGQLIKSPLQDAQTRVVFRAQAAIRDEIGSFVPKSQDLDYPHNGKHLDGEIPTSFTKEILRKDSFDTELVFQGWYPTLRKSIWLLSKIYRLVNSTVFDDLAHEVVHVCISSLLKAAELIKSQKSQIDSQLFLLKHFLLLKEQIVAFDIEYVRPDVDIDFSSVTGTFWEIREKGSLFNPNNLLKLVQSGMPKVVENMLDAKVELDARLRTVINDFTTTWATKIASSVMESSGQAADAMKDVQNLKEAADTQVPVLRTKLSEYINDSRTRETLIGAVQELVIESYENFYNRADKLLLSQEELWNVDTFITWSNEVFGGDALHDSHSSAGSGSGSGRESPAGSIRST